MRNHFTLVLAVGSALAIQAQTLSNVIVTPVNPTECELLTFSQHQGGSLTLSLRRPDDDVITDIPKMNWDNFSAVTKAPVGPQR